MTPWRLARSLETLRSQVNAAHPYRLKVSDGTIGDAAHAASVSDHNPDAGGVVRALDLTNDPDDHDGDPRDDLDATALAETLRASRDPRIKYLISNRRICSSYPVGAIKAWTWRPYSGPDPHTSHVHISIVAGAAGDSTRPWAIAPSSRKDWSDMATRDEIKQAMREVLAEEETARQLFTGHAICKDTRPGGNPKRRVAPSALLEQAAKP